MRPTSTRNLKSLALAVPEILISVGVKFKNVSGDPDHAPFRDDLTSAGWDLLPLAYRPNLKFLSTFIIIIDKTDAGLITKI